MHSLITINRTKLLEWFFQLKQKKSTISHYRGWKYAPVSNPINTGQYIYITYAVWNANDWSNNFMIDLLADDDIEKDIRSSIDQLEDDNDY